MSDRVTGGKSEGHQSPAGQTGESKIKNPGEFYRPPTRMELLRNRLERVPRMRLYVWITAVTWLLLTVIVGIDTTHLGFLGLREVDGYEAGDVADRDEYASRAVSYEDPVATAEARSEAADGVPETYRVSESVPVQVDASVEEFFGRVADIRDSDASDGEKIDRVSDTSPFYLSEDSVRALIFASSEDFSDAASYTAENLEDLYSMAAVADDTVVDIPSSSVLRLSEARNQLTEAAQRDASGETGTLVSTLSRGFLQPSYVIDRRATEAARQEAAESVEPVQATIQPGERIISRGEVVDREDVAQLEALGSIPTENPWTVLFGVGLIVAAQLWISWYFLERFGKRIFKSNTAVRLVLAASLVVLFTLLARVFVVLSFPVYTIPLAGLSMLGTILLGPRLMFVLIVVSGINIGIIAGNDFSLTAALLISSGFAIYTVFRVDSRDELLKAGVVIAVVTGVVTFAITLVGGGAFPIALWQGLLGIANGALSLMIAMVLLPVLENAFNLLTSMKLLELSDPGSPLLQKLLRKAPGTFSHSMQVGVMAENAAKRIGADPLIARVGAYYHDIGKMGHPGYFVENQIGTTNPHSDLSPTLSAKVIKRHVRDGMKIGRVWGLPKEIIDIIAQHHGLTRIEYFYRKAIAEKGEDSVRESDFRYSTGLPQSKEAGIMMLADTVEATIRSLPKPTPKRVEDVINDTIRRKIEDGQFDECELTLREIHEVGEAIWESVIGFLGPRIEYPGAQETRDKTKQNGKSVVSDDAKALPTAEGEKGKSKAPVVDDAKSDFSGKYG